MMTYINGLPWEKCPVPKCKNGVCYALDSKYCYPHTKSKDVLDKMLDKINVNEGLKQTN